MSGHARTQLARRAPAPDTRACAAALVVPSPPLSPPLSPPSTVVFAAAPDACRSRRDATRVAQRRSWVRVPHAKASAVARTEREIRRRTRARGRRLDPKRTAAGSAAALLASCCASSCFVPRSRTGRHCRLQHEERRRLLMLRRGAGARAPARRRGRERAAPPNPEHTRAERPVPDMPRAPAAAWRQLGGHRTAGFFRRSGLAHQAQRGPPALTRAGR